MSSLSSCISYQIDVAGKLDQTWTAWLNGMTLVQTSREPPITTLTGNLDQAKLRGIMNQLWDLNLTILAVRQLESMNER